MNSKKNKRLEGKEPEKDSVREGGRDRGREGRRKKVGVGSPWHSALAGLPRVCQAHSPVTEMPVTFAEMSYCTAQMCDSLSDLGSIYSLSQSPRSSPPMAKGKSGKSCLEAFEYQLLGKDWSSGTLASIHETIRGERSAAIEAGAAWPTLRGWF